MRAKFAILLSNLNVLAFARDRHDHALSVLRWLALLVPMAAAVGSLCAAFLWSLDVATRTRFAHPWLLFLLPVGGFAVGLLYHLFGRSVEGGNNLIVEQVHEPGGGVPFTHLFGGSAGREGTAVQLGGSLASAFATMFRLDAESARIILMAGIAAGFGAVFGTPLAGAIFALEVLAVGRVEYRALVPTLIAAVVGDWTCHQWGIHHGLYHIDYLKGTVVPIAVDPLILLEAAIAGVAFGLVGLLFSELSHGFGDFVKRHIRFGPLRPFLGGLAVIALVYLLGTRDYLGLGVWAPDASTPTIASFFSPGQDYWSWALKLLFTVVTLGTGFKGGEVTPLFFIGAALGHALGTLFGGPVDLFAGLGFVAVFAGAANTPLACTIMGIELFGATHAVYIAVACFVAYLCSGHSGIYLSQQIAIPKHPRISISPGMTLRGIRAARTQITRQDLHTND